ncbi:MAG: hypothetical protein PHX51_01680 [Clostridia bacterium]|nr:hypothetical protein [Clostridia bacterium]
MEAIKSVIEFEDDKVCAYSGVIPDLTSFENFGATAYSLNLFMQTSAVQPLDKEYPLPQSVTAVNELCNLYAVTSSTLLFVKIIAPYKILAKKDFDILYESVEQSISSMEYKSEHCGTVNEVFMGGLIFDSQSYNSVSAEAIEQRFDARNVHFYYEILDDPATDRTDRMDEYRKKTLFTIQFIYAEGDTTFDVELEQAVIEFCVKNYEIV